MIIRSIGITLLAIVQFALQSNAVEYLSADGYSSSIILLLSSIVMLILSTSNCIRQGLSPFPLDWRRQRVRMLCSGLALYLGTFCYHYLHATTASLIFQLNVPFIIIISAFSSRQIDRRLILSSGVVGFVFFFFGLNPNSPEPGLGIIIAFLSVAILAISYIQAKKAVGVENQYVIINITCLSCIVISLLSIVFTNQKGWHYDSVDIAILLGVGLLRYGQFLCLIALLRIHSADRAQFPFLIGTIATMFIEMWLEHHIFPIPYIISIVVLTIIIGGILSLPVSEPKTTSENPS